MSIRKFTLARIAGGLLGGQAIAALCLLSVVTQAEDWYRYRGPDLNGISRESGWRSSWSGAE